jgi:hypothetical protein
MSANRSRSYNPKDTTGIKKKEEKVFSDRPASLSLQINDPVEVYDMISGTVIWTGVVTYTNNSNGFLTVDADTARDRNGGRLKAKFSSLGSPVGMFIPANRRLRRLTVQAPYPVPRQTLQHPNGPAV